MSDLSQICIVGIIEELETREMSHETEGNKEKEPKKAARIKSPQQIQQEKLWKLKRRFRSGEPSNLAVLMLGENVVNFYGLPGVKSWRDLGNYEFISDQWVFLKRPQFSAADVALSDIYDDGRLVSLRWEQERGLIRKEVGRLNGNLAYLFSEIQHLIEEDQSELNKKWKEEVGGEGLAAVDPRDLHSKSVLGINELFSRPKEQPKVIVEQLLAKGWVGLLAGASKSYKSWMSLQLALAVSQGKEWLGFQTQNSRVLYVDYELSHASISGRVAQLCKHEITESVDAGAGKQDNESWGGELLLEEHGPQHGPDFLMLGANFDQQNQIAIILDAIRRAKDPDSAFEANEKSAQAFDYRTSREGHRYKVGMAKVQVPDEDFELYSDVYDLIIIDPLYMLLGGRDENSATEMADVFREINLLRKATGAAILINTHFRKGPRDWRTASSDRISGSGVFSRYPDLIMTLSRVGEGMAKSKQKALQNKFSLDITLRHLKGRDPIGLTLHDFVFKLSRRDETDIELNTEASPRGPKRKKDKEILTYLRNNHKKLDGLPLSRIIKHMEEVVGRSKDGAGAVQEFKKFKRSTLYKFFQNPSDHVRISGRNKAVTLAFAKRNE